MRDTGPALTNAPPESAGRSRYRGHMDQRQRLPETTSVPDVARVPLGRIDDAAREAVLRRVLGSDRQVPVASFQSRI